MNRDSEFFNQAEERAYERGELPQLYGHRCACGRLFWDNDEDTPQCPSCTRADIERLGREAREYFKTHNHDTARKDI